MGMTSNSFNVFVPFAKNTVYPDFIKGYYTKKEDGSTTFKEDPIGETYFKDPTNGNITKDWYIEGIASTVDIDRDDERMSEKALQKMRAGVLEYGINIFGNHEHPWENTLAVIKQSDLLSNNSKFWIKGLLDDPYTNPKVPMLLNKLKRGFHLGFSIGGRVLATKSEIDIRTGKEITIIDDIELLEVSVVGIPANRYCEMSLSEQIAKSFKPKKSEDVLMTKQTEVAEAKTAVLVVKDAADGDGKNDKKDDKKDEQPAQDAPKEEPKQDEKKESPADENTEKPAEETKPTEWAPKDAPESYLEITQDNGNDMEKEELAKLKLMGNYKLLRSGEPNPEYVPNKPENDMESEKSAKDITTKAVEEKDLLQKAHDALKKEFTELQKSFEARVTSEVEKKMADRKSLLKGMFERAPLEPEQPQTDDNKETKKSVVKEIFSFG